MVSFLVVPVHPYLLAPWSFTFIFLVRLGSKGNRVYKMRDSLPEQPGQSEQAPLLCLRQSVGCLKERRPFICILLFYEYNQCKSSNKRFQENEITDTMQLACRCLTEDLHQGLRLSCQGMESGS